jgi:hypothetical protein
MGALYMHFFKKISFLLLMGGVTLAYAGQDDAQQAINLLEQAMAPECVRMAEKISFDSDIAIIAAVVSQELPTISTKVAHAVNHDLTTTQRTMVIMFLQNLQNLTVTNMDDLMLASTARNTAQQWEALNKAVDTYAGPECSRERSPEEDKVWLKTLEEIDLRDPAFNAFTQFMCQCMHMSGRFCPISDVLEPKGLGVGYRSFSTPLRKAHDWFAKHAAVPYVVFSDPYFFPGWEDECEKTVNAFKVIHTVCIELLAAIGQGE